jgi:hypothetical protein
MRVAGAVRAPMRGPGICCRIARHQFGRGAACTEHHDGSQPVETRILYFPSLLRMIN